MVEDVHEKSIASQKGSEQLNDLHSWWVIVIQSGFGQKSEEFVLEASSAFSDSS